MPRRDVVIAPDGAEVELGPVGREILLENEHIRVWEVRLEPGEVQEWHLHQHPYLIIGLEAAENLMEYLDGGEARHLSEHRGRVVYREAGGVHKLTNVGQTPYVNRLIELKHLDRDGSPIET
jgi:quercetin dioxygenase-like cupin family protein